MATKRLSDRKFNLLKPLAVEIEAAMAMNLPTYRIYHPRPHVLKKDLEAFKTNYCPHWKGKFQMWLDIDNRLVEIRFNVTPRTEFSFNGEDFTEPLAVDSIIERAMFNRDRQTRFVIEHLAGEDLTSLRRLDKFFFVQTNTSHIIFTPRPRETEPEIELPPSPPSPSPYFEDSDDSGIKF